MNFPNWLKDPEISFVKRQLRGTKRSKHSQLSEISHGGWVRVDSKWTQHLHLTQLQQGLSSLQPCGQHTGPALPTKIFFKSIRSICKNNSTARSCFLCLSRVWHPLLRHNTGLAVLWSASPILSASPGDIGNLQDKALLPPSSSHRRNALGREMGENSYKISHPLSTCAPSLPRDDRPHLNKLLSHLQFIPFPIFHSAIRQAAEDIPGTLWWQRMKIWDDNEKVSRKS